jgi:hypothetical protein
MFQAKEVFDASASLLNDSALSVFTYPVQLPYLNIALDELQETMEQNNISFTNSVKESVVISAGITSIGGGGLDPTLPVGLVEIRALYERNNGSSENFVQMRQVEFLPNIDVLTAELIWWTWQEQIIKFIGATGDREVRIEYIKRQLGNMQNEGGMIPILNAKTFLEYRTAGLCALFIGENPERAEQLNGLAVLALDRFLSINTKGKQSFPTRRRPFMAAYRAYGVDR